MSPIGKWYLSTVGITPEGLFLDWECYPGPYTRAWVDLIRYNSVGWDLRDHKSLLR
jgi:hypothetical protein